MRNLQSGDFKQRMSIEPRAWSRSEYVAAQLLVCCIEREQRGA